MYIYMNILMYFILLNLLFYKEVNRFNYIYNKKYIYANVNVQINFIHCINVLEMLLLKQYIR